MTLKCPQCAAEMNQVTAEASAGYLIMLDQCRCCGGIWCDRWELYPVTAAAAARLDSVDEAALSAVVPPSDSQHECPRCRARMRRFRDPALPQDARIERCPNCDGMWLNRGELRRFKNHDTTVEPPHTPVTDRALDQLSHQACRDPRSWPTVTTLDRAFDATEPMSDSGEVRRDLLSGAAWLVARAALRLLLHV